MKIFSFILIVYILLLLTQPCQDIFAQINDLSADIANTHFMQQPTESDPHSEDCSPFCICSCRQLSTEYQSFTSITTIDVSAVMPATTDFDYQNPHTKNFHNSIWQPPKA